jgi:hypothetical protein
MSLLHLHGMPFLLPSSVEEKQQIGHLPHLNCRRRLSLLEKGLMSAALLAGICRRLHRLLREAMKHKKELD